MEGKQSSLVQVAKWLADEVGVGHSFTKQQLREALPQFEQVDRRMRDLRQYGWRIDTNREDATLYPNELRLVEIGTEVWASSFRPAKAQRVSKQDHSNALVKAEFKCSLCGVGVGERHGASGEIARLRVIRWSDELIVVCEMCATNAGVTSDSIAERLAALLGTLDREEIQEVIDRLPRPQRRDPIASAVSLARRLPQERALDLLRSAADIHRI